MPRTAVFEGAAAQSKAASPESGCSVRLKSAFPTAKTLAGGVNPVTGEKCPEKGLYADTRALRGHRPHASRGREKETGERLSANFGVSKTESEGRRIKAPADSGEAMPDIVRKYMRACTARSGFTFRSSASSLSRGR